MDVDVMRCDVMSRLCELPFIPFLHQPYLCMLHAHLSSSNTTYYYYLQQKVTGIVSTITNLLSRETLSLTSHRLYLV
jgi:hypothetical protein